MDVDMADLAGFVRKRQEDALACRLEKQLTLQDVQEREMVKTVGYNFRERERLVLHDTSGFKRCKLPSQETGKMRLAYDQVASFVQGQYGSRAAKDRTEAIQNLLFVHLLGMAAVYTDQANPQCYNRRPSYESKLLQRVTVQSRVNTLIEKFDLHALTPAVVIFDPEQSHRFDTVKQAWAAGDPRPLFKAVESYEALEPEFFTLVGNHSSEAHVRRWEKDQSTVLKRATYVFFKDQITAEDFRYISRTENLSVQRTAFTTAYTGHTMPLNVIPFIREYWMLFGSPPRVESSRKKKLTKEEQDYRDFQTLLHSVLEPPTGDTAGSDTDEEKVNKKVDSLLKKYAEKLKEAGKLKDAEARKKKVKEVSFVVQDSGGHGSCSSSRCSTILCWTDGTCVLRLAGGGISKKGLGGSRTGFGRGPVFPGGLEHRHVATGRLPFVHGRPASPSRRINGRAERGAEGRSEVR